MPLCFLWEALLKCASLRVTGSNTPAIGEMSRWPIGSTSSRATGPGGRPLASLRLRLAHMDARGHWLSRLPAQIKSPKMRAQVVRRLGALIGKTDR